MYLYKEFIVKKTSLLVAFIFCIFSCFVLYGENETKEYDFSKEALEEVLSDMEKSAENAELDTEVSEDLENDTNNNETVEADKEASDESTSKVDEAKEQEENKTKTEEENTGLATLPNGTGYVGVFTSLNLRDAVWGNIIGKLHNNDEVTITGRDGDWYMVDTAVGSGYAHARYIFDAPNKRYSGDEVSGSSNISSTTSTTGVKTDVMLEVSGDSLQGKIVSAADSLCKNYSTKSSFPYASATQGGRLGCAQVATTALVAAGALPATASNGGLAYASLSCQDTMNKLQNAGWVSVQAPPYQAGDVIFWKGTQKNKGANVPSHVGIIMESGPGTVEAMSNSSTDRRPRTHNCNYSTIHSVWRKL